MPIPQYRCAFQAPIVPPPDPRFGKGAPLLNFGRDVLDFAEKFIAMHLEDTKAIGELAESEICLVLLTPNPQVFHFWYHCWLCSRLGRDEGKVLRDALEDTKAIGSSLRVTLMPRFIVLGNLLLDARQVK